RRSLLHPCGQALLRIGSDMKDVGHVLPSEPPVEGLSQLAKRRTSEGKTFEHPANEIIRESHASLHTGGVSVPGRCWCGSNAWSGADQARTRFTWYYTTQTFRVKGILPLMH